MRNQLRMKEANELRCITDRIVSLERERADAREQTRLLIELQTAITTIAVARLPEDVIVLMLRAARDPLGFDRAIYFSVDRQHGVEARLQIDGCDVVEPSDEEVDLRHGSSILSLLRHEFRSCVGRTADLSAPLVDVRGWYVLSALSNLEGPIGLLYVDGHGCNEPREWEVGLIESLTTIASISIDNSVLFSRTRELAMRDPLTGLLNRRAFAERLAEEIANCDARGSSLTYVLIDVDDFKAINDSLGHAHGDAVLRKLSETLTRSSRVNDIIGRYAGDEFVIVLPNVEKDQARTLVARLSSELRAQQLSCSVGAASYPQDAHDPSELLTMADKALYATKTSGKNGYTFAFSRNGSKKPAD